jgi:hypothetical protein
MEKAPMSNRCCGRSSSGPSLLPMKNTPAGIRTISADSFESAPSDTRVDMTNIKTKTTMVARARIKIPDPTSILRNGENIGKKILFTQSFHTKLAGAK